MRDAEFILSIPSGSMMKEDNWEGSKETSGLSESLCTYLNESLSDCLVDIEICRKLKFLGSEI